MKPSYLFYLPAADALIEKMLVAEGHRITVDEYAKDIDCVFFTGGEDVSPFLYGERVLSTTHVNPRRDLNEVKVFKRFAKTPKVGVCRGAQFLNVMCGGRMWQDVDGHGRKHSLIDFMTGVIIDEVTSTHHQMMIPHPSSALLIASAHASSMKASADAVVKGYLRAKPVEKDYVDPEVIYYEHERALCFQPHPEYGHEDTHEYFWSCFNDWVLTLNEESHPLTN